MRLEETVETISFFWGGTNYIDGVRKFCNTVNGFLYCRQTNIKIIGKGCRFSSQRLFCRAIELQKNYMMAAEQGDGGVIGRGCWRILFC